MKWQQAYHRTKANKITRVTTSERDRKKPANQHHWAFLFTDKKHYKRAKSSKLRRLSNFFLILFTKVLAEYTSNQRSFQY